MDNGKQSPFPLTKLAAKYNEMQTDGRIMSNRASLEIIRTRIRQLLERIDINEAPDRLLNLHTLWSKYVDLEQHGNHVEAIAVRNVISEEFEKVYHDYQSWKQMFEALDLDRKMVESEVKIVKDIQAILTAEDAYELSAKLLAAIISAVAATEMSEHSKNYILKRIQYEFTRIVGDGHFQRVDGSSGEGDNAESDILDSEGISNPGDAE